MPSEASESKLDPSFAFAVSLLNSVPVIFWTTDAELNLTSVAGGVLNGARTNAVTHTGRPVHTLFERPETRRDAANAHAAALNGNRRGFFAEINGRELQAYVGPLRGTDSNVAGTMGLAVDLTERLVAERALRISEQSYRSLIDEAPCAIARSTISGQLLQVNRAMIDMLGYDSSSEQELLIRDLPLIFIPGAFEQFKQALAEHRVAQGLESVWLRRDGREIQVRLSGRAVHDERGAVSFIDVLAEDVTEKKQLELQLSHAQKMQAIGQLAGGVAHDFNNLLTVISGNIELVMLETEEGEVRSRLESVKSASERATALTRQLLAFSRRQVLRSKIVDINDVITQFSRMLTRLIKESVKVTLALGPDAGCIHADPNQIEQVLMNLAVNAQDAMPDGGQLTIETAKAPIDSPVQGPDAISPGEYVRITVRDTGRGMDAQTQARIFEPFFTTKNVGEGTGLGLSMVYGILRQSGGHITVESAPWAGSTFTIYLPRVPGPDLPRTGETSEKATRPRGNETILLAEDEDSVRTLLTHYLRHLG
ncbi:MAG TPA: ATP-binding protein, partial [Bryobacteraceae bacterium]|nr:ATP-binding protein [Bryobacteraceae bacterium]